jgi:hypothetical protein
MIKYRAYDKNIEPVKVVRETDKKVFFISSIGITRHEAKRSHYWNWFDTWEEARKFLLDEATAKVNQARNALQRAHDELGNIKGMKPPKEQS